MATGKTADNGTRSSTGTTTPLSATTFYKLKITLNSMAKLVTFEIYNDSVTLLWINTLSTNIPTSTGRETVMAFVATNSGTTATDLVEIDYLSSTYASDRGR